MIRTYIWSELFAWSVALKKLRLKSSFLAVVRTSYESSSLPYKPNFYPSKSHLCSAIKSNSSIWPLAQTIFPRKYTPMENVGSPLSLTVVIDWNKTKKWTWILDATWIVQLHAPGDLIPKPIGVPWVRPPRTRRPYPSRSWATPTSSAVATGYLSLSMNYRMNHWSIQETIEFTQTSSVYCKHGTDCPSKL
jgi:hypothetical protein